MRKRSNIATCNRGEAKLCALSVSGCTQVGCHPAAPEDLLFAKAERDRDALVRQFLDHSPVRQYFAVVRGHLGVKEGLLFTTFDEKECFKG